MGSQWHLNPRHLHAALSAAMASGDECGRPLTQPSEPSTGPHSPGTERLKSKRVEFTPETESEPVTAGDGHDSLFQMLVPSDGQHDHDASNETSPRSEEEGSRETIHHDESPVRAESSTAGGRFTAHTHHDLGESAVTRPKPAIRKDSSSRFQFSEDEENQIEGIERKREGMRVAHEAGERNARQVESYSSPASGWGSPERDSDSGHSPGSEAQNTTERLPLKRVLTKRPGPVRSENGDDRGEDDTDDNKFFRGLRNRSGTEADRIAKAFLETMGLTYESLRSGQATPVEWEENPESDYVPKPARYKGGVLTAILRMAHAQDGDKTPRRTPQEGRSRQSSTDTNVGHIKSPRQSPPGSGTATPSRQRPRHRRNHSSTSVSNLVGSSSVLAAPVTRDFAEEVTERLKDVQASSEKLTHSGLEKAFKRLKHPKNKHDETLRCHINDVVKSQKFLMKLCRALMKFGAPTHRLEQYLSNAARMLEIESDFLYIPGCMMMSFEDSSMNLTEVKLVRTVQGVDLGKLRDTHEVYKDVVHSQIDLDGATERLDEIMKRKEKFPRWFLVLVYGIASATVGPFAFQARPIDMPVAFLLGCVVGFLQLFLAPKSDLYSNVFEIFASVLTAFLARAFGSIGGGEVFCFSAIAQSSIALILPGYMVLCASLELLSRNIVSGSVRMVHAIIYSLILGFGITIGAVMYQAMDRNATSNITCSNQFTEYRHLVGFVVAFTLCLTIINQAKWKQTPVMLAIAVAGYSANFWSAKKFVGNAQITNTIGAFAIGVMANFYARLGSRIENWLLDAWYSAKPHLGFIRRCRPRGVSLWPPRIRRRDRCGTPPPPLLTSGAGGSGGGGEKGAVLPTERKRRVGYGLAATAMLPAIFVQVPSGLAVSGSLVAGITSANQIAGNATGTTVVANATEGFANVNSAAFTVGLSVVQVALGISVGLFLSVVFVYPYGKKNKAVFSF